MDAVSVFEAVLTVATVLEAFPFLHAVLKALSVLETESVPYRRLSLFWKLSLYNIIDLLRTVIEAVFVLETASVLY